MICTTHHDTLMISGRLYDEPWIHSPATTVLENNEVLLITI